MSERELFQLTAGYAADFLETLDERPIRPKAAAILEAAAVHA